MGRKRKWTKSETIKELRRVMDLLGIDHLPTFTDLSVHSTCGSSINRYCSLKTYSELMGVPMAETKRPTSYNKNGKIVDCIDSEKVRPSRAFDIEKEMRRQGLHYKDYQIADTLRRAEDMAW